MPISRLLVSTVDLRQCAARRAPFLAQDGLSANACRVQNQLLKPADAVSLASRILSETILNGKIGADDPGGVAAAFGVMRLQVGDSGILEESLDERRKGIPVHKVGIHHLTVLAEPA